MVKEGVLSGSPLGNSIACRCENESKSTARQWIVQSTCRNLQFFPAERNSYPLCRYHDLCNLTLTLKVAGITFSKLTSLDSIVRLLKHFIIVLLLQILISSFSCHSDCSSQRHAYQNICKAIALECNYVNTLSLKVAVWATKFGQCHLQRKAICSDHKANRNSLKGAAIKGMESRTASDSDLQRLCSLLNSFAKGWWVKGVVLERGVCGSDESIVYNHSNK